MTRRRAYPEEVRKSEAEADHLCSGPALSPGRADPGVVAEIEGGVRDSLEGLRRGLAPDVNYRRRRVGATPSPGRMRGHLARMRCGSETECRDPGTSMELMLLGWQTKLPNASP